jgi:hypothetical protein
MAEWRHVDLEAGTWFVPKENVKGSRGKQIGDRQHRFKQRKALSNRRNDNSLVLSKGENGEWTPRPQALP